MKKSTQQSPNIRVHKSKSMHIASLPFRNPCYTYLRKMLRTIFPFDEIVLAHDLRSVHTACEIVCQLLTRTVFEVVSSAVEFHGIYLGGTFWYVATKGRVFWKWLLLFGLRTSLRLLLIHGDDSIHISDEGVGRVSRRRFFRSGKSTVLR